MADTISTKPYLVRAIHEWCTDNDFTPHLLVVVDEHTRVPMAYVKEGEIVLNLNYGATKNLHLDNDAVVFSARFNGEPHQLYVPMHAIKGIFARENGQGMFFDVGEPEGPEPQSDDEGLVEPLADAENEPPKKQRPQLKIVK